MVYVLSIPHMSVHNQISLKLGVFGSKLEGSYYMLWLI